MLARTRVLALGILAAAVAVAACGNEQTGGVGPTLSAPFQSVSTGLLHACALTTDSRAFCWGWGERGQLGNGATEDMNAPVAVAGNLTFAAVIAGGGHTCGITTQDEGYCWGFILSGQLGNGANTSALEPVAISGGLAFAQISASAGSVTCSISNQGPAYCWGFNQDGQLGDGTSIDRSTPVEVQGGLLFRTISTGTFHVCGITDTDEAWCWGRNSDGQLGDGTTAGSTTPVMVSGGLAFSAIDVGFEHTCGVTTDGDAYCWGTNPFGQLGDGGSNNSLEPSQITNGTDYAAVSAGGSYSCGVKTDGVGWCWGFNQSGQLGNSAAAFCLDPNDPNEQLGFSCSLTPVQVNGQLSFQGLNANTQHTCGITNGSVVYCWGLGDRGQLGNGESGSNFLSVDPVRVARQP